MKIKVWTHECGWAVQIGRYGISIEDRRKYTALFSERNRFRRFVYLGRYKIEWL